MTAGKSSSFLKIYLLEVSLFLILCALCHFLSCVMLFQNLKDKCNA